MKLPSIEQQQGFQDGVSFAYNLGIDNVSENDILQACQYKSETYIMAFASGFSWVKATAERNTDVQSNHQKA